MPSSRLNARLMRYTFKLQPWRINIEYLPGHDNFMAHSLSRHEWEDVGAEEPESRVEIAKERCE